MNFDEVRVKKKLSSLEWIPQGEIDDTRFEKLYTDLKGYCNINTNPSIYSKFLDLNPLSYIKVSDFLIIIVIILIQFRKDCILMMIEFVQFVLDCLEIYILYFILI